jgi:hypothetical protein
VSRQSWKGAVFGLVGNELVLLLFHSKCLAAVCVCEFEADQLAWVQATLSVQRLITQDVRTLYE